MKNSLFIAGVIFLAGCGGGSGDGGSPSLPDPKSEHSKDYEVSLLQADFQVMHGVSISTFGSDISNSVHASLQYKKNGRGVYLTGTDEIEVLADGVKLDLSQKINNTIVFDAPVSGTGIYEFVWRRDGQIIAQASLAEMPIEFTPTFTYDGTLITYSWPVEANHKYAYVSPGLNCDSGAFSKYYSANEHWRDNVINGGAVSFDLAQAFSTTDAELRSTYSSCDVITDIIAEDMNLTPLLSGSNINVNAWSSAMVYKLLF